MTLTLLIVILAGAAAGSLPFVRDRWRRRREERRRAAELERERAEQEEAERNEEETRRLWR